VKLSVFSFDNVAIKDIDVEKSVADQPLRPDILHRVVEWQLSKRRLGTRCTKGISDISGTTKKPYKQKGTGNARHGSLRSPQFRKGAVIFGPVVRSHEYSIPKKVRRLALRAAVAGKIKDEQLKVIDVFPNQSCKTATLSEKIIALAHGKVLVIHDGVEVENFVRGIANLRNLDVLPVEGLNVYDLLNHDSILISEEAFKKVQERIK
jgi:large subunit ribosomal protein L4